MNPPVRLLFTRADGAPPRSRAELEAVVPAAFPDATSVAWRREGRIRLGPDRDTQFIELDREDVVARVEAPGLTVDLRPFRAERDVGSSAESHDGSDVELQLLAWRAWGDARAGWERARGVLEGLGYVERTFDWSFLFGDAVAALTARGEEAALAPLLARRRARLLELWREPTCREVDLGHSALLDPGALLAEHPDPARVTSVQLHRCDLAALPPELERFQAVTHLNLHDNRLASVPPLLDRLPALELVNLWRNPVAADAAALAALAARRPGLRIAGAG